MQVAELLFPDEVSNFETLAKFRRFSFCNGREMTEVVESGSYNFYGCTDLNLGLVKQLQAKEEYIKELETENDELRRMTGV